MAQQIPAPMSSTSPKSRFVPRMRLGFAILFLVIAVLQLHWFATNPWMSIRLAPAFEMARGNPIYPTSTSGPYVSTLYGFIGPLFYAPFAWIPSADWALRITGVWTVLWTLGAGLYILNKELKRENVLGQASIIPCERAFLLATFVLSTWALPSLRYGIWEIHADAPAHVLVLLVCFSVLRFDRTDKLSWLLLAGAAAGTAPWAKQTIVFSLLGPFLWLWLARGWKAVLAVGGAASMVGGAWFLFGAFCHGARVLWFNLFTLPGSQPWVLQTSKGVQAVDDAKGKLIAVLNFINHSVWVYGPIFLLLAALILAVRKWGRSTEKPFLRGYPAFTMFALTAICALPALILGSVKLGGDVNSAAFAMYPAILALTIGAGHLVPICREHGLARPAAILAFVSVSVLSLGGIAHRIYVSRWPTHGALQQYVRSHPGEAYCPSDPLVHVLEENACPPVGDIILSMDLGGFKVSREQFDRAFSGRPKFKHIIYPPFNSGESYIGELFPSYSVETTIEGLRGLRAMAERGSASTEDPAAPK